MFSCLTPSKDTLKKYALEVSVDYSQLNLQFKMPDT